MPRYDVPKAAPEPLRRVQLLVNSADLENERDWLPDWLRERGLEGQEERALSLREALRALVLANNGRPVDAAAVAVLNRAAARLEVGLDADGSPRLRGADPLDDVVAVAVGAMLDGSWRRLKACRNCRWCFYDYSPNRSATWCSMQLCGNRRKTRAYRSRRRSTA
ncbi:MAG TPA: CGNR zinc finger domain-containing protein [Gaiellaceae bacterium]|nr:CGNR zinc finger domain-containing protein [Gaiellaceae bacterium]